MPETGYTNGAGRQPAGLHSPPPGRNAQAGGDQSREAGRNGGPSPELAGGSGSGDGRGPVFTFTAGEVAALVAAGRNHGDQARDHGADGDLHGQGRRRFPGGRAVAQAAVKHAARGNGVWIALAAFVVLSLLQAFGVMGHKPSDFLTSIEPADPFANIVVMK